MNGALSALAALGLVACHTTAPARTAPPRALPPAVAPAPTDDNAPPPAGAWYELSLGGQKLGYAQQLIVATDQGAILRHSETVKITRSGTPLTITTGYSVTWDGARWQGKVIVATNGEVSELSLHARRGPLPPDDTCMPAVFAASWWLRGQSLPPCGVSPTHDHLTLPLAAHAGELRWRHPWGDLVTTVDGAPGAMPLRMVGSDGTTATWATPAQAQAPWTPPDLLALTAVPATLVRGGLRIRDQTVPTPNAPPEAMLFPGQQMTRVDGGDADREAQRQYALGTTALPAAAIAQPGQAVSLRALRALVADVGATRTPSLATGADVGDCKVMSALAAARLEARQAAFRVATGWRYDHARRALIRHRWLLVRTPAGWISIDPTFGEVPAKPVLIGLIHEDPTLGAPTGDLIFAMPPRASNPPSRGE